MNQLLIIYKSNYENLDYYCALVIRYNKYQTL